MHAFLTGEAHQLVKLKHASMGNIMCIQYTAGTLTLLYTSLKVFKKHVYYTKCFDHTTVVFFSGKWYNNSDIADTYKHINEKPRKT